MRVRWCGVALATVAVALPAGAQTRVDLPPRYVADVVLPPSDGPVDGPVGSARVWSPTAMAIAPDGSLYFADLYAIRRVSNGVVSTVAGLYREPGHIDGPGLEARLGSTSGLAVTADGTVLIADATHHTIRRLTTDGRVSTWLGVPRQQGFANGRGSAARFLGPEGVAVGPDGVVYIIDSNCTLRRVTPQGDVQPFVTVQGTCVEPPPSSNKPPIYRGPVALAVASDHTVHVARQWGGIVRVAADGSQTHVATSPERLLRDIAMMPDGRVRVLEAFAYDSRYGNNAHLFGRNAVFDVASDGTVTSVATLDPETGGSGVGVSGLAIDATGVTYVGNVERRRIDRVAVDGTVSTWFGGVTGRASVTGLVSTSDGALLTADDSRQLRQLALDGTLGPVLHTASGQPASLVRIGTDTYFSVGTTIHRLATDGSVSTVVTLTGSGATLSGLAANPDGSLLAWLQASSPATWRLERVTPGGAVTPVASGSGRWEGMAVSAAGVVHLSADRAIYRLEPDGSATRVIGDPTAARALVDGPSTEARLVQPTELRFQPDGSLLFVDGMVTGASYVPSRVLRRMDTDGRVTSLWSSRTGDTIRSLASTPNGALYLASGGGVLSLRQATPAPLAILVQPQSVSAAVGSHVLFTVGVSGGPAPLVIWQESRDAGTTWTTLTDVLGNALTGNDLWVYGVTRTMHGYLYRAAVSDADEFTVSAPAELLVTGLSVTPGSLRLAATRNTTTGALVAATPPQTITVTFAGGSSTWTAASSVPWLSVSPASGSGTGQVHVTVVNPGDVIGNAASLIGGVSITPSDPTLAALPVTVTLTVTSSTNATTAPVGVVDTPMQNASGLQGAIAMTGWVVDDVGIQHVRIYRQCTNVDQAAACQSILGQGMVLLGDASIIPGARPDVEAAYPSLPASASAGWGFLILSNLLPDLTAGAPAGGVGAFTLFAVATDVEGRQTLLGRNLSDHTPTGVLVANDSIAKPFGAIDTPAQGATVTGLLHNFGWVLTPDTNTVPDAGDVLMPTTGATIGVFIDGQQVGTVTYDLCRGTVGNPVPSGVFCDDDVSAIFRAGSRYRNLDAGRGAIGLRSIDTTTLADGLHTIQWGVTDSAGRSEGIGSRYFSVANGAADPGTDQTRVGRGRQARRSAGGAQAPPYVSTPIYGRTGFDVSTAYVPLRADADGVAQIRVPEMGRVELQVDGAESVALLANGTRREPPVGLAVDARTGTITWSVGPGYLGRYRLEVQESRIVDVIVEPREASEEPVRMHLDAGYGAASGARSVRVEGWALDPDAATGTGVGAVHVWARRTGPSGPTGSSGPVFLGAAQLGVTRGDVSAAHGDQFLNAGFRFIGRVPDAGEWEITAYVWVTRTGRFEDARAVPIVVR